MSSSNDKRFLIRSSGHILGPFFKDEVIDLIKKGKLSILDEVAEPYTIWFYLQDHADFKKIVHSMSMQTRLVNFLSSVSTKVSLSKNTNEKKTEETVEKTLTETSTKAENIGLAEKQAASEASIENVKLIQGSDSDIDYKSETESEEAIRKKVARAVDWSWKLIVSIVFLIGVYIFYKEFYKPFQQNKITISHLNSKGLAFYNSGNFIKALPFFETAYSNNLLTDEQKILFASMLIQEDKIPKAIAIKNEILDSLAFQQTKGLLLDILIDYYQNNDVQFENKVDFVIKNSNNPKAVNTVLFNLALYHWEKSNHKKSIELLDKLISKGFNRNIVSYLKALNLFSQRKLNELEAYITADTGGLAFLESKSTIKEFKQEFYFLLAYIYMKKENKKKLSSLINKLLNEDPFLYQEYKYSSFMAKKILFNWLYFSIPCKAVYDFNSNNNLFKALYSFCFLKAKEFKNSLNYINQIKNTKDKNHPLFVSLDAYFAMTKNKKNTAQLEEQFALINFQETKLPLPFILKARFFENQKNWGTALLTWKQLLSFSPDHLSGNAGAAFNSYQLNNPAKADIYAKKALKEYSYYIKLLPYQK